MVNSPLEALDLLKAGDYSSLDVEAFRCLVNPAGQDLVLLDKYFIIIIIIIDTFKGASSTMLPKTLERAGWPWQKTFSFSFLPFFLNKTKAWQKKSLRESILTLKTTNRPLG